MLYFFKIVLLQLKFSSKIKLSNLLEINSKAKNCKLTQAGNSYIFTMNSIHNSHIKMVCAAKRHGCRKTLKVVPVPPLRYLIYCRLLPVKRRLCVKTDSY